MWHTGRFSEDEIVGRVIGLPTWLVCILILLGAFLLLGLVGSLGRTPNRSETLWVDLSHDGKAWTIRPIPVGVGLPAIRPGSNTIRLKITSTVERRTGRRGGSWRVAKGRLELAEYPPEHGRDFAMDVMQAMWADVADAANAAWPGRDLDRSIRARGSEVSTTHWVPSLASCVIMPGAVVLILVAIAAGQASCTRRA